MGFTSRNHLFRRVMLSFESLTYNDESARACALYKCLIVYAFKMYHQTETVIVKMIKVNPINCLEFMWE